MLKKLIIVVLATTPLAIFTLAEKVQAVSISGFGDPINDPELVGGTKITFDSTTPGLYRSITVKNIKFTGVDAPLTIGSDFNGQYNTNGGNSIYNDFDLAPQSFRFDFTNEVNSFAFNWGASDFSWTLSAFDSNNNLLDSRDMPIVRFSNAGEYYGIAANNISYATLSTKTGDYVFIDNFSYKEVPEPLTILGSFTAIGVGALLKREYNRKSQLKENQS